MRALARRPAVLLPVTDRWLAVMSERLGLLAPEGEAVVGTGQVLLLTGLLLLALRRDDDRLGRAAADCVWSGVAADRSLGLLAGTARTTLQRERIDALALPARRAKLAGLAGIAGDGRVIALRDYDLLGVFVCPASVCAAAALVMSVLLRRLLDRTGINRFVWNRALFDFSTLIALTALLVLTARPAGT